MTQLQAARSGIVTEAMRVVAADEGIDVEAVRMAVASDEAHGDDHCSMCGKPFCAVRTSRRIRKLAARMKRA